MAEYEETLAETAAADDVPLGVADFPKELAEEADGADVPLGVCDFPKTLAEAAAGVDAPSYVAWIPKSVDDSADLADLYPNIGEFQHTIANALTLADVQASSYPSFIVAHSMGILDGQTANWQGGETLAEALGAYDNNVAVKLFIDTLAEGIGVADAAGWILQLLMEESMRLSDQHTPNLSAAVGLAESFTWADGQAPILTISPTLGESLGGTDAVTFGLGFTMAEAMHVAALHSALGELSSTLAEQIAAADDPVAAFAKVLAETVGLADAHTIALGFIMAEGMTLAATMLSKFESAPTYAEALGFGDSNIAAWGLAISEGCTATDAAAILAFWHICQVSEAVAMADALAPNLKILPTLSESMQFEIVATCMAIVQGAVDEGLGVGFDITLGDSVWLCVALNGASFEPSVYSEFDFRSYCRWNGETYAADDTAIYRLTGDTDDGAEIHTTYQWGAQHFGTLRNKRIRKATLGVIGTHPAIKVDSEAGGETYLLDARGNAFVSSAIQGRRFTVAVRDFDELEFVELVPVILTR